jgi:hypothetical protein
MKLAFRYIALIYLLAGAPVSADEGEVRDTLIAAISYNLARFVEPLNPAKDQMHLVLCYAAGSPVGSQLQLIQAGRAGDKPLRLRAVEPQQSYDDNCDVIFVEPTQNADLVKTAGVITIGVGEGVLDAGGSIQLEQAGQRFTFSVNVDALRAADMKMSSRVLQMAKEVRSGQ